MGFSTNPTGRTPGTLPLVLVLCLVLTALLGCSSPAPALSTEQQAVLDAYGIQLTPEQIRSVDMDAFLHDLSCFFGDQADAVPIAAPVENAACERY